MYQKASGDDAVMTVEIDSDSTEYPQSELHYYTLRNLEKETNYSIEIKAKNTAGFGVPSLPQYHYTKELGRLKSSLFLVLNYLNLVYN